MGRRVPSDAILWLILFICILDLALLALVVFGMVSG
jgi:hypothetical protein